MSITGSIQQKNNRYHMVINMPMANGKTKQKWEATGLPVRGNKKKAMKMLTDRLTELNKGCAPYYELTVAEYFTGWLKEIEKEVRPNTYRSYYGNMVNHIIPYFEKKKILLQNLKPYHLEDYYKSKLEKSGRVDATGALSPTTIKHHHQNISKALSDALRKGMINNNPASVAKTPQTKKFIPNILEVDETKKALLLFKGMDIEIPVILSAAYGLRRSEVLGLQWKYVDFEKKTIVIAETLQQHTGGDYISKTKTPSSHRTLLMNDYIYNTLKKHKELQESRKEIMGNYYFNSDHVCTFSNGKVISPNYLSKTFRSIMDKSGLPHIRLHDLRHSLASNLIAMGISYVDVQSLLGHANASTTLDIYSHATRNSQENIANILQNTLFNNAQ